MELGKAIRKLRELRNWSQDELAFRSGTSAANISRIENGKHGAGEALLEALAKEFDLKIYQLIAMAEGIDSPKLEPIPNPEEDSLLSIFRQMDSEQQKIYTTVGKEFIKSKLQATDENKGQTPK